MEPKCRDCKKNANIISPDALLGEEKPGAKAIAALFEGIIDKGHCCGNGGPNCYAEE